MQPTSYKQCASPTAAVITPPDVLESDAEYYVQAKSQDSKALCHPPAKVEDNVILLLRSRIEELERNVKQEKERDATLVLELLKEKFRRHRSQQKA